jgi:hypothetical protein
MSPYMISLVQVIDQVVGSEGEFLLVLRVRITAIVAFLPPWQLSQKPCSSLSVSSDTTLQISPCASASLLIVSASGAGGYTSNSGMHSVNYSSLCVGLLTVPSV